jgi:hypothetical protein
MNTLLHSLPYRTDLVAPIFFLITFRHGLCIRHIVNSRTLTVSEGTCIPRSSLVTAHYSCLWIIYCIATDVAPFCVSRQTPTNESCFTAVVATAVSLPPQFLLWANFPQYYTRHSDFNRLPHRPHCTATTKFIEIRLRRRTQHGNKSISLLSLRPNDFWMYNWGVAWLGLTVSLYPY